MPDHRLTLRTYLLAYAVALLVMGLLDALWLGWLARDFYRHELGALMTDSVRLVPAALYYLLYPAAIVYLALTPVPGTLRVAVLRSAVLGLTAFGVYDLTNLATIRGYSPSMAALDMAWGVFATAVGGGVTHALVMGDPGHRAEAGQKRPRVV